MALQYFQNSSKSYPIVDQITDSLNRAVAWYDNKDFHSQASNADYSYPNGVFSPKIVGGKLPSRVIDDGSTAATMSPVLVYETLRITKGTFYLLENCKLIVLGTFYVGPNGGFITNKNSTFACYKLAVAGKNYIDSTTSQIIGQRFVDKYIADNNINLTEFMEKDESSSDNHVLHWNLSEQHAGKDPAKTVTYSWKIQYKIDNRKIDFDWNGLPLDTEFVDDVNPTSTKDGGRYKGVLTKTVEDSFDSRTVVFKLVVNRI